ncbi:hypothetical protein QYM36_004165, partial [Artemia franciscana]
MKLDIVLSIPMESQINLLKSRQSDPTDRILKGNVMTQLENPSRIGGMNSEIVFSFKLGSSDSRHFTLRGHDGRTDSVIFYNKGHRTLLQHLFVYFGGDVQDEPEAMEKHRDNKRFSEWNLQRTAKLLSENNHVPVLVIKPS